MIKDGALETSRLMIRPFETSDVNDLVNLFSDSAVFRYVGDGQPLSAGDAVRWVARSGENLQRHGYGTGAVIQKASGRLVGWAGFARPEDGLEQIIYGLSATHWRKGFGREILAALIDYADCRDMTVTAATVDPANVRSVALLRYHGFNLVERSYGGDPDSDLYKRYRE